MVRTSYLNDVYLYDSNTFSKATVPVLGRYAQRLRGEYLHFFLSFFPFFLFVQLIKSVRHRRPDQCQTLHVQAHDLDHRYSVVLMLKMAAFAICCQAALPSNTVPNTTQACVSQAQQLVSAASISLNPTFTAIDTRTQHHLSRILSAFREHRVSSQTFLSADGYGHSDHGRQTLDDVYATFFNCEAALVRIQFLSGTHAIASVLFGVLRPGDDLIVAAGPVYDTLEQVLGTRNQATLSDIDHDLGSLNDCGIRTTTVPLTHTGHMDIAAVIAAIRSAQRPRMVFVQRSFGYSWRDVVSLNEITMLTRAVRDEEKNSKHKIVVFVDNCYGELVDEIEPVHDDVGADVMAGSLIKNLGGGLVPSGGYVAGRAEFVRRAAARLSAPGVGGGATLGWMRAMFQGLFMSPGVVGEALKGSLLVGEVMSQLGYQVLPRRGERGFVRAVRLGCEDKVLKFCQAVQRNGPVGAFVEPTKGVTDGYADEVVFAQGTFIDGSTIELSADGPMREPYIVFAQGALHWTHWAIVLEDVVQTFKSD